MLKRILGGNHRLIRRRPTENIEMSGDTRITPAEVANSACVFGVADHYPRPIEKAQDATAAQATHPAGSFGASTWGVVASTGGFGTSSGGMGAGGFGATSTGAALSTTLVESQALISQLQLQMDQQQLQLDELRQRVLWTFPEVESSLEFLNTPVVSSSVTNVNPVADRPGLIRGSASQAQQDGEGGRGEGGQVNIGLSIHHAAVYVSFASESGIPWVKQSWVQFASTGVIFLQVAVLSAIFMGCLMPSCTSNWQCPGERVCAPNLVLYGGTGDSCYHCGSWEVLTKYNFSQHIPVVTDSLPPDWRVCAFENEQCSCPVGIVRYGANGVYAPIKEVITSIGCNNTVFGDPISSVDKRCECKTPATTKEVEKEKAAQCDQSFCTSPDLHGGFDCWAAWGTGGTEPFTCRDDYQPIKTGRFENHTWGIIEEYTCCPKGSPTVAYWTTFSCPEDDTLCSGCYDPVTHSFSTKNTEVEENRSAMIWTDWAAVMLSSVVLAFMVSKEVQQDTFCELFRKKLVTEADQRFGLTLLQSLWLWLERFKNCALRFTVLPLTSNAACYLVIYRGGDALTVCFNTLGVLFVFECDDLAYGHLVDAATRAAVEKYMQEELGEKETNLEDEFTYTVAVFMAIMIGILVSLYVSPEGWGVILFVNFAFFLVGALAASQRGGTVTQAGGRCRSGGIVVAKWLTGLLLYCVMWFSQVSDPVGSAIWLYNYAGKYGWRVG
jgi:hypothetical protein